MINLTISFKIFAKDLKLDKMPNYTMIFYFLSKNNSSKIIKLMQNAKQYKKDQASSNTEPQPSKISIIQSTIKAQKTYHDRIRGKSFQTKQLNIHMKTLNEKYLKKCAFLNQLSEDDISLYFQYKKMKANFQSSRHLYGCMSSLLKQSCRNYSRSSDIVKDIFRSQRMFINNKIIFIKFLRKVQTGIDIPNTSWKQQYFKNKISKTKSIQNSHSRQIEIQKQHNIQRLAKNSNDKEDQNGVYANQDENKNQRIQASKKQSNQNQNNTEQNLNLQKASHNKQSDNVVSVRTIFAGNLREKNKQPKEKPRFGQSHIGGQFLFSISNSYKQTDL